MKRIALVALALLAILPSMATAIPIFDIELNNNNGTFGNTEDVIVELLITNIGDSGGDFSSLSGDISWGNWGPPVGGPYDDSGYIFPVSTWLDAGNSIVIDHFRFGASQPVPSGDYFAMIHAIINPTVLYEEFRWTVTETSVPEPGTLALFGIGLFGIGLARRNRKA